MIEHDFRSEGWRDAQRYGWELDLTRWALSVRARQRGEQAGELLPACAQWWERRVEADGALTLRFVGPDRKPLTGSFWPELRLTIAPDGIAR